MLLVLWGITIVSFVVIHLAPGSPTDMETTLNPLAGEAARRRLDALYGLDRPLYVQYWDWLCRLVHFDFGVSMSADGRPVMDKILERLPLTVGMNVASLILTLLISVPIGVYSACRRNSLFDRIVTVLVYIGFAMPSFWFALLLMLFFGIDLNWLPLSGVVSLDYPSLGTWGKICDVAKHLALPITVYTVGSLAGMSRYMRACMLEVLDQDYMLTARAKGLPQRTVIWRHGLRNALLPLITLLGLLRPRPHRRIGHHRVHLRPPRPGQRSTRPSWPGTTRSSWGTLCSAQCSPCSATSLPTSSTVSLIRASGAEGGQDNDSAPLCAASCGATPCSSSASLSCWASPSLPSSRRLSPPLTPMSCISTPF